MATIGFAPFTFPLPFVSLSLFLPYCAVPPKLALARVDDPLARIARTCRRQRSASAASSSPSLGSGLRARWFAPWTHLSRAHTVYHTMYHTVHSLTSLSETSLAPR